MKKLFYLFTIVTSLVLTSCSSDDDSGSGSSRDIKYEITGNFTSPLDVTYIAASGGATSTEVTSLPWTLSFTADASSSGATFNAGGSGTPGQTISLKVYQGGELKSTTNAVANSDGIIVATAPAVTF